MKVAAHAHGAPGINAAIRAGVDTIEHASLIDDEGIKLAPAPAVLSMDIYNTDYTQAEGKKNGVLEDTCRRTATSARSSARTSARRSAGVGWCSAPTRACIRTARREAVRGDGGVRHDAVQAIQAATINASQALAKRTSARSRPAASAT